MSPPRSERPTCASFRVFPLTRGACGQRAGMRVQVTPVTAHFPARPAPPPVRVTAGPWSPAG